MSNNPNKDAGSIPGFSSATWYGNREGEAGKILNNQNDPSEIHLHKHPDGITISDYRNGKAINRFNFNTGKQEG